ncbi:MAG: ATP-binding protein, partial [Bacteroidota bacterium]
GVDNGARAGELDDRHTYIMCVSLEGREIWRHELGQWFSSASASIADLDGNGNNELVVTFTSANSTTAEKSYIALCDPATGKILRKMEFADELQIPNTCVLLGSDSTHDLIVATNSGMVYQLDGNLDTIKTIEIGYDVKNVQVKDVIDEMGPEILLQTETEHTVILNSNLEFLAVLKGTMAFSVIHQKTRNVLALHEGNAITRGTFEPAPGSYWRWIIAVFLIAGVVGTAYGSYKAFFYLQLYQSVSKNTTQLATIVLTRRGRTLHVNDAATNLLGTPQAGYRGKTWKDLFPNQFQQPVAEFIAQAFGANGSMEEFLTIDQGSYRVTLLARLQQIQTRGMHLGSLIFFDNITSVVRWASVAQNLAHEMKTPLSTIWFTLERMRQQATEGTNPASLSQHTASISEELRRLDAYIKGFMKLANLNPPNLQECNINEVVADLLERYTIKLPATVKIETCFASNLPTANLDVHLFTVAITNLLDNAVTAMQGVGVLKLSTSVAQNLEHKNVCLTVADSGCGIAPEDVPKVFDPYFTKSKGGTGLGLIITKKIIEDHGGKIEFTTQQKVGTEFVIRVPVRLDATHGSGHA